MRFSCFVCHLFMFVPVFGDDLWDGKGNEDFEELGANIIDADVNGDTLYGKDDVHHLVCPDKIPRHPYFSLPCFRTKDCSFFGKTLLCCKNRCEKGILAPKRKRNPNENFLSLTRDGCPLEPLIEIFPIKECGDNSDCFPRICCPDDASLIGGYCRTPFPNFDQMPGFLQPLKSAMSYMQCTPPPPPFLDFFPKPCRTQFDCFPNLCCQERGKQFCRPPKRSIFALMADFGQRFGTSEFAKRFIARFS